MKTVMVLILAMAAPAMGLSWSEDFNSYPGGTADWGASAVANGWQMPTVATKLDGYLPNGGSGLSPRMGNAKNTATSSLGGGMYGTAAGTDVVLTYRAAFSRGDGETEYSNGHDYIALGKTQADIDAIPHNRDTVLSTPVDAVALGHQKYQGLYFFDGDSWTNIGDYSVGLPYANNMRYNTGLVTLTITDAGAVTVSAPDSSGVDVFTIPAGFQFSLLALDHENAVSPSGPSPATYDDLGVEAYTVSGGYGACCLPDLSCIETSQEDCATLGGEHNGDFTTCAGVLCCGDPPADADGDGDVDQDDHAVFQGCMTSGLGTMDPACECLDLVSNGEIDEDDWGVFEACASGPDVPADATCDDPI